MPRDNVQTRLSPPNQRGVSQLKLQSWVLRTQGAHMAATKNTKLSGAHFGELVLCAINSLSTQPEQTLANYLRWALFLQHCPPFKSGPKIHKEQFYSHN